MSEKEEKEICDNIYLAALAVDVEEAKAQLADARSRGVVALCAAVGFLVLWVALLTVRYRMLTRRVTRLVVEAIGVLLAIAAFICTTFAVNETSEKRTFPFIIPVDDIVKEGPQNYVPIWAVKRVPVQFGEDTCPRLLSLNQTQVVDIRYRASFIALARTKQPLTIVSVAMSTFTLLLCLIAIVFLFIVVFGKRHAKKQKTARITPSTLQSLPNNPKVEIFSRLIQAVPNPPDNVILSASSQCAICAEAMLEDIVCLPACKHLFHRNCILHWLLLADKPKCPICEEPLRQKAIRDSEETNFSSII